MPIVFACIVPHGGHLLLPEGMPTPVPLCRAAMAQIRQDLEAAQPETLAILTPHGVMVEGAISLGMTPRGIGELDGLVVETETDLELAAAWGDAAASRGIPVAPLVARDPSGALPLDWGVTIPLALLTPTPLPTVVACPARDLSRDYLIGWGEALVEASAFLERRVALIVSADQGHGHAAGGPYGFTPESALYDLAMREAIEADDLPRLLSWPEEWPETALADSYWQTLALIGVQKHVSLRPRFLAYEVDHYFGLLCASFTA